MLSSLPLKFFVQNWLSSYEKKTPRALIAPHGHLIPNGFSSLCFEDPIHIPSVFELSIFKPDRFPNSSKSLKNAWAEFVSERTAVVSSAYWRMHIEGVLIKVQNLKEGTVRDKPLDIYVYVNKMGSVGYGVIHWVNYFENSSKALTFLSRWSTSNI